MNPPQGAGFLPHGPHGQGNQPHARTPAGAYQMMYVPVVQYPGQQQQQQHWTPHGGGTVPMMMAQGQVMMAVPQGAWGAPAAAGWAAQMQQHYGQQQQQPPQQPQPPQQQQQQQQQQWFGTVGGGPPPPPPPPPAADVHPAPSSPSKNPPGGKRNRNRGKNRGRGAKPADPTSRSRPDADEGPAPPGRDSLPAKLPESPQPAFKREKGVTFPTVDEIPAVKPVDVASLPEDVRRYREERAKNWPSRTTVERRRREAEERCERGELSEKHTADDDAAKTARRAALREILARQRELGHFEASEEIGEELGHLGGITGDEEEGGGDGNRKGKGRGVGRERDDSAPAKRQRRDAGGGAGGRQGTRPCRYWQLGKCRRGDACDFVHAGDARGNRAGICSTGAENCPTDCPTNAATNAATPCRFFLRGRCKSGRRCAFAHDESAREKAKADKKAKASTSIDPNGGGNRATSFTLLRKLLAREVRADRSRLLQVFRFLVNNDFLRGHDPSRPGNLWMFPWVDDPVRSPKETLRALAAEAERGAERDGEEPSLEEEEETDGEAEVNEGVNEEEDV